VREKKGPDREKTWSRKNKEKEFSKQRDRIQVRKIED
jgi:hypothetical protein